MGRSISELQAVLNALGAPVQKYEGWGDVGYNYMIGPGGQIYECRSLAYDGAHVAGHNAGNIGIAARIMASVLPEAPQAGL